MTITEDMEAKFSQKVKEVISLSREEALRLSHDYLGIEHLLLGILREGGSLAIKVLRSLEIDLTILRRAIEDDIKGKHIGRIVNANDLPLNKQVEKV